MQGLMDDVEVSELPTTSYVILGLLTFREMSGYDLKQLADKGIRHFYWSPAKSQIYAELRRLEEHGYVTMREVPQTQRPDKRLYKITPEGMEAMQKWLANTAIEADSFKSSLLLKLFLGNLVSLATLSVLVEERQKYVARDLRVCQAKAQELRDKMQASATEDDLFYPLMTLERSIAVYQAEMAWMENALVQLKQREAKSSAKKTRRKTATSSKR
jgi:DNA-binding PadR family transcriptional regulator